MSTGRYRRALVTGGAGLVGSNIVNHLLEQGLEVVSLDDLSAGTPRNLDAARESGRLSEIVGDITDDAAVDEAMRGIDVVFHQAVSKNTVCMRDPQRDLEVNAGGTLRLLLAAVRHGVQRFVHASSGSVYGRTEVFPTTEDAPLSPVSYYGVSKLAAERYVHAVHTLHGLPTTILRYFHVFGPGQDSSDVGGVVPIFLRQAMAGEQLTVFGDGTQVRAFTYVKDVARINWLVANHDAAIGRVYNCGSDVRMTIGDLARRALELADRSTADIDHRDWRPGDIKRFDISNEALKQLGFEFQYDFDAGFAETANWVRGTQVNV